MGKPSALYAIRHDLTVIAGGKYQVFCLQVSTLIDLDLDLELNDESRVDQFIPFNGLAQNLLLWAGLFT